jgi:hypothetical protein
MTEHLQPVEIELYLNNELQARDLAAADEHLRRCEQCRRELKLARSIDSALREVPRLLPSGDFTGRVMRELGIGESQSFIWGFLSNLAPLVAMVIVSGLIYLALAAAGVMKPENEQANPVLDYRPLGDAVDKGIGALNGWLVSLTSNLGVTTTTALFLVFLLAVIVTADRFLFVPFLRRRGLRV